jgi:hypothetical protein
MKQRLTLLSISVIASLFTIGQQNAFVDSTKNYVNNYIKTHDVIKGEDIKYFRFFEPDETYNVKAAFTKVNNGKWFQMETSGPMKKTFRVYGTASFSIHDTSLTLNIYQMQSLMDDDQYKDYLFLPFTDLTTGIQSYHTGRYIDFRIKDIKNGELTIDFNKAYNPSCAYVSGKYNCPVPPRENHLPVAIQAGEMNFAKGH